MDRVVRLILYKFLTQTPPKCFHILLDEFLSHLISETQTAPVASFQ